MNVYIDIETIPNQTPGAREQFIEESVNDFKAPSNMTKTQAIKDLGGDPDSKEWKYKTKDDCLAKWAEAFKDTKAEEVGVENWRKTALDGSWGEVFSIAWAVGDGDICSVWRAPDQDELDVLRPFESTLIKQLKDRPAYFIGQNVAAFDLRFLYRRYVINNFKPGFHMPHAGRHGKDFFDIQQEWCGFNGRMKLDVMCRAMGIEGKPDDIDGSKVWDFVEAGDYERVVEYNEYDVEQTRKAYKRMVFAS